MNFDDFFFSVEINSIFIYSTLQLLAQGF